MLRRDGIQTRPLPSLILRCVVVEVIRRKSAPTSSLFLRARTSRAAATTKTTRPSAAKRRSTSFPTCLASIAMSRVIRGVEVHSLGKWDISRLSVIVGHSVSCPTHHPE